VVVDNSAAPLVDNPTPLPSSGPITSSIGLSADPPFEFIDPSSLLLEGFDLPEPPAGVFDLGSFFAVSDFPFADV
jgi:hypothetical protein